jgi:hypothetical protein
LIMNNLCIRTPRIRQVGLSLPRIARRGWVILFLGLGSWGLISFWEHFHRVSTP